MNIDERRRQREEFVVNSLGTGFTMEKASEDASFRSYWRIRWRGKSWIVMDAPPDLEDVRPFVDISTRLRNVRVRTPIVHVADCDRGFLLLDDFGDALFADALGPTSADGRSTRLYDLAFDAMTAMQDASTKGLPIYDNNRLAAEMELFVEWTLGRQLAYDAAPEWWQSTGGLLLDNAGQQPQSFVHRDFHCGNLMVVDGTVGVIDFQDAVRGPVTYDLASLIWDRYLDWPRSHVEAYAERARIAWEPDVESGVWMRWLDWMGVQRNLKVVGIFARLSLRDGKHGYLRWQARFLNYLVTATGRYPELRDLHDLLVRRVVPRLQ